MEKYGKEQGNMTPEVKDYQRPAADYSQTQPGRTTEYISRKNAQEGMVSKGLKRQAYKGRYS